MKKVLVIAAHPDDEVLGCGATIAKHTESGDKVAVLILGEGVTSRTNLKSREKENLLKQLQRECQQASKILGVTKLVRYNFPDNKFDTVPLLNVIKVIEKEVERFSPTLIYTHSKSDVNIDHRRTLEAVESAIRPVYKKNISQVLSFEVASSTEWNFVRGPFKPNFFNTISKRNLAMKLEALDAYRSEKKPFPHPRSNEYLEALAKIRGAQSGQKLSEAFEIIYQIN